MSLGWQKQRGGAPLALVLTLAMATGSTASIAGSTAASATNTDETCLMQTKSELVQRAERAAISSSPALTQKLVKPLLDISNLWDYEMDAGGLTPHVPKPECSPMPECDEQQPPPKFKPHPFWRPEWWRCISGGALRAGGCLFIAGIICCAGGIGGGGIYVTVLMVFGNLSVHDAIPLSKVVVFAASTPSLILNLLKTITLKNGDENQAEAKTLIDWNLCRIVVPFALMGTLLGVFLNNIIPGKIIIGLLSCLLIGIMIMLCRTGYEQHCKERVEEAKEAAQESDKTDAPGGSPQGTPQEVYAGSGPGAQDGGSDAHTGPGRGRPAYLDAKSLKKGANAETAEDDKSTCLPSESGIEPSEKGEAEPEKIKDANVLGNNEIFWAVSALCIIIYCGTCHFYAAACVKDNYIGQPMCHHPIGQVFIFGQMPAMKQAGWLGGFGIGCMVCAIMYNFVIGCFVCTRLLRTKQVYGSLHNFESLGQDYDVSVVAGYIVMSILTGCLAGLVGIGGGLIFSPVFIYMRVDPHIAVASSATCVIFTSSSTTFQYLFTDRIIVALIVSFCVPHLAAAYTGTKLVHYIQDNYGTKKSWITWIVAVGVGISAILAIMKFFQKHAAAELLQVASQ